MNPKITFLMTAYNAEKYIAKAIESVLKQTEEKIALYIRNNGSTDLTGEIIRRYAASDKRIYYVENTRNNTSDDGVSAFQEGWWACQEAMTGQYFSILDADDWLAPDFAERMYSAAISFDADMVIGGCHFVNENSEVVTGKRIPPQIQTDHLHGIGPYFKSLYPSLRTWWGKLYKNSFFIENYKYCWSPEPPLKWVLDTITVLKYVSRSSRIVSIDEPLYYFLIRETSAYSAKPLDVARNWEADACYKEGLALLNTIGAHDRDNVNFLMSIHWGYLVEAMRGLVANPYTSNLSASDKLVLLASVLNNKVLGNYSTESYPIIYRACETYIAEAIKQEQNPGLVWRSYLARLYFFENNLRHDLKSPLVLPMLLSCLCDPENINFVSRHYIEGKSSSLQNHSLTEGGKYFLHLNEAHKEYCYTHPRSVMNTIYKIDRTPLIEEMENELIEVMKNENYERACELVEKISLSCPFSMVAMYYRIYFSVLFDDKDMAGLLASVAKVLWPKDKDIQLIYWEVSDYILADAKIQEDVL